MDAASGGFIAPFIYPELEWDFRLPLVKSINVSGHKYGLVYAGVGWVIWRSKEDLPDELIFHINYLGADQPTFTLNFSKGRYPRAPRSSVTLLLLFEFVFRLSLRATVSSSSMPALLDRFEPDYRAVLPAHPPRIRGNSNSLHYATDDIKFAGLVTDDAVSAP